MADLFDVVVAKKLSGGGGGGGGDASVATVTFVDPDMVGAYIKGAFCFDDPLGTSFVGYETFTDGGEPIKIALYKGTAEINAGGILEEGATFTVSGNATADGMFVYVTGDCTITVVAG